MEKSELERLRKLYLNSLDELNEKANTPWIEPEILANKTGTTISQISDVILNSDEFVENSRGKISTRNIYKKSTPFLRKLKDSSTGIIE
ncbi:MAG: hypothetical protein R6W68_11310 [Ignavibacteriaceae bacterium]